MIPSEAPNYGTHPSLGDAELFGDCRLGFTLGISHSDCDDIIRRKDCLPMLGANLPIHLGSPSFVEAIPHIIGLSTEEKMSGIDARRVVAFVENPESIRDGTKVDFPRDAVGFQRGFSVCGRDVPVSAGGTSCPFPTPTDRSFVDFRPKSFFDGFRLHLQAVT